MEKTDVIVVGIGGATCGGKTTLVKGLVERHPSAVVVNQDDFYKDDDEVSWSEAGDTRLWDVPESLHLDRIVEQIVQSRDNLHKASRKSGDLLTSSLLIIEGTMAVTIESLKPFLTLSWFFTLNHKTMVERRKQRTYVGVPDSYTYFEDHVWPSYMRDLKEACKSHGDGSFRMIDGTKAKEELLDEVDSKICKLLKKSEG